MKHNPQVQKCLKQLQQQQLRRDIHQKFTGWVDLHTLLGKNRPN
ncbi:hypothetical protein [Leclercia adecarboxylata]|nr:hypothetical protein [Leclercia adecarboxylata]